MKGVEFMKKKRLPTTVAMLDANLYLMAPAQKKRFLRYRRAYILADRLATPILFASIGCILLFPYRIVALVAAFAMASVAALILIWYCWVLPSVEQFLVPCQMDGKGGAE